MSSTSTSTPTRTREADLAAASAHLKESWAHAKDAAGDAGRVARTTWRDFSSGVDRYVETRPWTVVLGALGTGIAVGFLTGRFSARTGNGRALTEV